MLRKRKKAQAILEIGVLGALILMVFAVLLTYIQRLNDDQYTLMNNFREALKKAHDENAIVSYTTLDDRKHLNLYSPLQGQRAMASSSNNVHWSVPYVGTQPKQMMIYKINEKEYAIPSSFKIDSIVYDYDTKVSNKFDKDEQPNIITSKRTVNVDEDMLYILMLDEGSSDAPAAIRDTFVDPTLDEIKERLEDISDRESGVMVPIWQTRHRRKSRTWITEQAEQ